MAISIAVTAVRYAAYGTAITDYKWLHTTSGQAGESPKAGLIDFVEKNPGTVGVGGDQGWAVVQVVGSGPNAYLRTVRDGTVTDNLEKLPRF